MSPSKLTPFGKDFIIRHVDQENREVETIVYRYEYEELLHMEKRVREHQLRIDRLDSEKKILAIR